MVTNIVQIVGHDIFLERLWRRRESAQSHVSGYQLRLNLRSRLLGCQIVIQNRLLSKESN